jgi:putative oxidoreductase
MNLLLPVTDRRVSLALLLLRIATGASFLVHGYPKLAQPTSWLNNGPVPGIPAWLQLVVTIAENLGGLCILLGLATRLFAFLQACDMIVAGFVYKMAHGYPYVGPQGRHYEVEAHLLATSLVFLLCGAGVYSIDALLSSIRSAKATRGAPAMM